MDDIKRIAEERAKQHVPEPIAPGITLEGWQASKGMPSAEDIKYLYDSLGRTPTTEERVAYAKALCQRIYSSNTTLH